MRGVSDDAIRLRGGVSSEFAPNRPALKALDQRAEKMFAVDMRLKLIMVILTLVTASCVRQSPGISGGGPGAALVRIIDLANRGEEEGVARLVTYSLVADFDENLRDGGTDDWGRTAKHAFWKKLTRNGTVGTVVPRDEKISGDYALVNCDIVYRDGSRKDLRAEMKLIAGRWILIVYPAMLRR